MSSSSSACVNPHLNKKRVAPVKSNSNNIKLENHLQTLVRSLPDIPYTQERATCHEHGLMSFSPVFFFFFNVWYMNSYPAKYARNQ